MERSRSDGWELETPVVFFVFNRPARTERVLERISEVQPSELFVVADGPRDGNQADGRKTQRVRGLLDQIEWKCEVRRNYAERNLGIKKRFSTGLDWVFDQAERAIILEDDCLPDRTFFKFCQTLLEKYDDDKRILDITGTNFLGTWKDTRESYHYSIYGGAWGWATWRRAWDLYDPTMRKWQYPEIRDRVRDVIADDDQFRYQARRYQMSFDGELDTWDYPWGLAKNINWGLSIVPSRNLVTNIGFDENATNTKRDSPLTNKETYSMEFPLNDPDFVAVDRDYDRRFHERRRTRWDKYRLPIRLQRWFNEFLS